MRNYLRVANSPQNNERPTGELQEPVLIKCRDEQHYIQLFSVNKGTSDVSKLFLDKKEANEERKVVIEHQVLGKDERGSAATRKKHKEGKRVLKEKSGKGRVSR